jgi:hypothetical protein
MIRLSSPLSHHTLPLNVVVRVKTSLRGHSTLPSDKNKSLLVTVDPSEAASDARTELCLFSS